MPAGLRPHPDGQKCQPDRPLRRARALPESRPLTREMLASWLQLGVAMAFNEILGFCLKCAAFAAVCGLACWIGYLL